jgi:hypothetical protein
MYISKAFKYRVIENEYSYGKPVLKRIPVESGWLTDTKFMKENEYSPAPYDSYKGDKALAFWNFDKEMALAIDDFGKEDKGKSPSMVDLCIKGRAYCK